MQMWRHVRNFLFIDLYLLHFSACTRLLLAIACTAAVCRIGKIFVGSLFFLFLFFFSYPYIYVQMYNTRDRSRKRARTRQGPREQKRVSVKLAKLRPIIGKLLFERVHEKTSQRMSAASYSLWIPLSIADSAAERANLKRNSFSYIVEKLKSEREHF